MCSGRFARVPFADGNVEPWEKEVYERIVAADTDRTGFISVRKLFDFIHKMRDEVKEASSGGIPISSLNPDSDGDGKVEKWELEVFDRIKDADADGSGSINVKELVRRLELERASAHVLCSARLLCSARVLCSACVLCSSRACPCGAPQFGVIKGAAESDRLRKLFQRLLVVAILIIGVLVSAMLGMGIIAGEAIKESHVSGAAEMVSTGGQAVRVDTVETSYALWDMPSLSSYELGKLEFFDCYIDMTSNPQVGSWTAASFKPAGMYKPTMDEMVIYTAASDVSIVIDRLAQTGTVQMGGIHYPISDTLPEGARRRLVDAVEDEHPEPMGDRRRLGRRGGRGGRGGGGTVGAVVSQSVGSERSETPPHWSFWRRPPLPRRVNPND